MRPEQARKWSLQGNTPRPLADLGCRGGAGLDPGPRNPA